ncbi:hypothetical protein F5Y17DRAFT_419325 [Xylariaceae sp. FL0594]|nr:hypothetical protein F5Y17DRAFT_419325 [Xylariaceae sp. FL0594]
MQLKRKRSESELSTSTTCTSNSPLQFGQSNTPCKPSQDVYSFNYTPNSPLSPLPHYDRNLAVARAPGRTMKRFRDNRPSETEVHQRTLDILYAAQRQQHQMSSQSREMHTVLGQLNDPVSAQPASSSASHQASLHSFWNLPPRPLALPASNLPDVLTEAPTECQDCGQRFQDGDDLMMDGGDVAATVGTECGSCGKHVCSNCSISNLGEQWRCLMCAGTSAKDKAGCGRASPWSRGISNWLC